MLSGLEVEVSVKALQTRFGVTAYDDPMEALTRLKQTSTVVSYKVTSKFFPIGLLVYLSLIN